MKTANPQPDNLIRKSVDCPHNALRKSKKRYAGNMYICGNCATLFEVKEHVEPPPPKATLEIDHRPPWGLRSRQA